MKPFYVKCCESESSVIDDQLDGLGNHVGRLKLNQMIINLFFSKSPKPTLCASVEEVHNGVELALLGVHWVSP